MWGPMTSWVCAVAAVIEGLVVDVGGDYTEGGRVMECRAPPVSIWQKRFCVEVG